MGRRFDTISFLSDLGLVDESVGVVKAIVRDLAPHATVIDLTHQVPRFDVRAGSLALARSIGYVPSGVVMAVVDSGRRRPIAIEVAGGEGVLIGPDNGLLPSAVAMAGGAERCVVLSSVQHQLVSAGLVLSARDVFAPAAAHLCNGADIAELGEPVDPDSLLPGVVPLPREAADGGVHAEVLWVDHFGNCQLNVGLDDVAPWGVHDGQQVQVVAGEVNRVARRAPHGGVLGAGTVGLVVDAFGLLALTLDRRSAADELMLSPTDQVTLGPLVEHTPAPASPVAMRPRR